MGGGQRSTPVGAGIAPQIRGFPLLAQLTGRSYGGSMMRVTMITIAEIETKSILTKTAIPGGDFVANPYVGCPHKCLYCYADFMRRFTNHEEKWGDFLDVKRCGKKINIDKLRGKTILMSSVTDAYNPFEQRFEVTRELLKQLVPAEANIQILTKSALVLRDRDLFRQIPGIRIGISLNTLDETVRKKLEPYASSVSKRIDAVKTLHNEGFATYIFVSPFFPGITDFKEIVNTCKDYTGEFWFENLNLRGGYRRNVLNYIRDNHRHLTRLYEAIYQQGDGTYWETMEKDIDDYCRKENVSYKSYFYHEKIKKQ
jgi:DNA repair photolyase